MQVFINDNARFNIKCLSMIMLDSKKKYFPQTLLEECKYEPKKMNMENLIDDDLEKVRLMSLAVNLIIILMMKQNLMMRKIMINLTNNFLQAKKVF